MKSNALGNLNDIAKKYEISWATARRWSLQDSFPAHEQTVPNHRGQPSGLWNMAAVDAWVAAQTYPQVRESHLVCITTIPGVFKVASKTVYRWLEDPNFPPEDALLRNTSNRLVKGWEPRTIQNYINANPDAIRRRRGRKKLTEIPAEIVQETIQKIRTGELFLTTERKQQLSARRMLAKMNHNQPLYRQSSKPDWYYQD